MGRTVKCPKCDANMAKLDYEGIYVNRCPDCKGLWFDAFELQELKKLKGSETIDLGANDKSKENDENRGIDCPVCHTQMIKMVDIEHHMKYEACTVCYGVYFDAGEFKEYKHETLMMSLKKMLLGKGI
ncbi:MAG: zf-TFIIB domain-containing protein [Phycisphaerae bacterium]|nr:zf-TFIIB domain-containing protein [Phycisphaerae bacterium]